MLCKIGETVGKSLEEVVQLSVLEIQMWAAYFKIKYDADKKGMNSGNTKYRNPRIR